MKTNKNIITAAAALAACAAISVGALTGCASGAAGAEAAPDGNGFSVAEYSEQFGPWVPDGVTLQASATLDEAVDGDAVVEVLDEAGNTVQMTAAEAKASGKQVVSGGATAPAASSQGGSAPSAGASTPSAPSAPVHEHNWQWVVDKAAWDETKYETVTYSKCNGCGADITGNTSAHMQAAGRGSACSSYRTATKQVPVGTIHHDAVGHYSCSCGATK